MPIQIRCFARMPGLLGASTRGDDKGLGISGEEGCGAVRRGKAGKAGHRGGLAEHRVRGGGIIQCVVHLLDSDQRVAEHICRVAIAVVQRASGRGRGSGPEAPGSGPGRGYLTGAAGRTSPTSPGWRCSSARSTSRPSPLLSVPSPNQMFPDGHTPSRRSLLSPTFAVRVGAVRRSVHLLDVLARVADEHVGDALRRLHASHFHTLLVVAGSCPLLIA